MSLAQLVKELRERTGAGMMDCKKALEATESNIDAAIDWLRENGIAKAAKKGDRIAAEGLTKVVVDGNKAVIIELNSETDFVAKNEQFLTLLDQVATGILNSDASTVEEALAVVVDGETIDFLITSGTATIGEKLTLRRFERFEKTDSQSFGSYSHMGGKISTLVQFNGDASEVAKQIAMHAAAANPKFATIDDVDSAVVEKERQVLTAEVVNEGKPANIAEKMVEGRMRKFFEEICLTEQVFVVDSSKKVHEVIAGAGLELIAFARYEVGEGIEKVESNFAEEVAAQAKL